MDLLLEVKDNTWDIIVTDGTVKTISGDVEDTQKAMIAAFIQKNTIPMLPAIGNDWTDYILGKISILEIDMQARATINKLMDDLHFVPYYTVKDGQLLYNVSKVTLKGEN